MEILGPLNVIDMTLSQSGTFLFSLLYEVKGHTAILFHSDYFVQHTQDEDTIDNRIKMPPDVYFSVCHLSLQTQSSLLDPTHFSIAVFTSSYAIFKNIN